DLIVCSHLSLAPVGAAIRFFYRTPFWVVCHGSEACARLNLLERVALRQSDLLLPVSRFTAVKLSEVHQIPQHRARILHNAIPRDFEGILTARSEEHTSELQSPYDLVCRLLPPPRYTLFPYTTLFRSYVMVRKLAHD